MKLLGECCVEVAFVVLDRKISTPVQVTEMVTLGGDPGTRLPPAE